MTSFITSTSVSTSSGPQWYNSTPLLLEKLPPQVHSTPRNASSCSSIPSRSRDSGLGSLASDSTTFSFTSTFCPPLSPNATAFSIENLLGLSKPKQESSSTKQERALQPLNLSTSALPRPRTYSCRYCSKAYSSRSSMRAQSVEGVFPDSGCWRVTDVPTPARGPSSVRCANGASLTGRTCVRTSERIGASDFAAVKSNDGDVDAIPSPRIQAHASESEILTFREPSLHRFGMKFFHL
ncbi:hypothetical protein EGR_01097 [Echinococcus granulosus]|uniref:Uncharacterized protein n=1 Tax=Echinococcus granulosus TaxID=6210 RepID=W6VB35_ECHGR|nr:hypothetical protein EGR_01097 [Echinococcus granulosus]EUB63969.1 hypothetical protein EGR_01097 [Echinococcus granulosus]